MKFGKRFTQALPLDLAPFALPYTPLKQHLKHVLLVAAQEDLLGGGGDDSETTSSGGEGAANGDHVLANGNGSQAHSFKPSAGQVADFQRRIKDGLESPAQLAERLCAELTTEMGALRPCRDGVEDERLPELLDRVEQLHCFVVLNYVAVFKLVKKWNKAVSRAGPACQLSGLALLLPSPLFSSRSVQLLFQRAAKWKHEGSQHGGNTYAAAAAALATAANASMPQAVSVIDAVAGEAQITSSAPMNVPAGPDEVDGIPLAANTAGSSGTLSVGSGDGSAGAPGLGGSGSASTAAASALAAAATAPVRCEGCVRMQTRFVALGCSHTFCWGCVAAALVHHRRRAERALGGGGGSSVALNRGSAGSLAALDGMPVPTSPAATAPGLQTGASMTPLGAAGPPLARRLSASSAAFSSWPEPLPEDSRYVGPRSPAAQTAAAGGWPASGEHPLLECPICDSVEDLDQGHLEVNALLSDDSFVWMLSHDGETCGNRRGSSRSRLAGIDFATLNMSSSFTDAASLLAASGGQPASSLGTGAARTQLLPGRWGQLGRVPSWETIAMQREASL